MHCKDCGEKAHSWQEYCRRCGGALFRRESSHSTTEHSFFKRVIDHHS